jgi:pyruvate,water dikinase
LGAADRALRDPHEAAPDAVRGVPASPGRATGRARIVRSGDEFDQLRAGEVLVCRVTTPSWTPLFARAAAVVTDVGSPSAHASIIAREYGIPAVVGTGDGTTRIADGAIVTVDGGAGLVLPSS